jgi:hypothetical protein
VQEHVLGPFSSIRFWPSRISTAGHSKNLPRAHSNFNAGDLRIHRMSEDAHMHTRIHHCTASPKRNDLLQALVTGSKYSSTSYALHV